MLGRKMFVLKKDTSVRPNIVLDTVNNIDSVVLA